MTPFTGPLYVVGSPRSGTKLLRDLLNRNPHINLCDPESHFIPHLFHKFGAQPDHFAPNLDEFFAEFDKMPFQIYARRMGKPVMTRADFDVLTVAKTWDDALSVILRFYGDQDAPQDAIWGDKTPSYVLCMPLLKKITPNARFVHIIRDPRDVALSVHAAWKHNILRSAKKWARNVAAGRRDGRTLGDDYIEVYYEDVIRDPATTLGRVCAFLDIPYSDDMTTLARPSENIGSAAGKTFIDSANLGKFRKLLREKDQRRIEEIVFEQAKDTPYTPDFAKEHKPLSRLSYGLVTATDGARSGIRYVRKKGLIDGLRINIGNMLQKSGRLP